MGLWMGWRCGVGWSEIGGRREVLGCGGVVAGGGVVGGGVAGGGVYGYGNDGVVVVVVGVMMVVAR